MPSDVQVVVQAVGEQISSLAAHLSQLGEELLGLSPESTSIHNLQNGNGSEITTDNTELRLIEDRCRVKAEGCRWAAERVRLYDDGAEHKIDIAPRDRYILDKARRLSDCNPWMNRPEYSIPDDLSLLDVAGGCFDALAESVAVARLIHAGLPDHRYLLAESLQLIAEAQSALRCSIQQVDGPTDHDQISAYRSVIDTAQACDLFIERFLHCDDPADPTSCPDLLARIQSLKERVEDERALQRRRHELLCRLRYQLVEVSDSEPDDRLTGWKPAAKTVDELVQTGLPPSNPELREVLLPHVTDAPQFADDPPQGYVLALREIRKSQEGRGTRDTTRTEARTTCDVAKAAKLLKGKRLVLIGGDCRPDRKEALEQAFGLTELDWVETQPGQSVNSFAAHIARPDVAAVLLAIRWASHGFVEVRRFCDRYQIPLVWLPGGYGVNQVAAQIVGQCSNRLKPE